MPRLREIPRDEVTAPIVTTMYDFLFGQRDPGPGGFQGYDVGAAISWGAAA